MFSLKLKSRKGLSEIVGATILILLVVLSASLIFISINSLLEKPGLQAAPFASCIQIQEISPELLSVRYNSETKDIEATIKRHVADDYSQSFDFLLQGKSKSDKYTCGLTCGGTCNIQNPGETKTFYFAVNQEIPEKITFFVNGDCEIGSKDVV
jgi:hypothetical protein